MMKEETPKCCSCVLKRQGNPMIEVGELAGDIQVGEYREEVVPIIGKAQRWYQTGVRHPKLYQCFTCKEIKIF